ncbi:hypothetical protein [Phaeobacter italicus]|jgi:hypothetical protein|uniref:hypothetical protein n=1 Tax=Phaeobacter italicus TaxID=481446 RepID=UPI002FDA835B
MAKVLIGCETSGIVREAFLALGHDAWSCDLLPSDTPTNRHIQGDVREVMLEDWDLMVVMHPPCTRLCNSGVRWLSKAPPGRTLDDMWRELDEGAALFSSCWNVPHIPCVAIENPVMHRHAKARIENYQPPAQTVQPWQFGSDPDGPDNEKKRTCLWLRGLPQLNHTGQLDGSTARDSVHKASPGADRWKIRSKFFPGIAAAMADQWGAAAQARHAAAAA